MKKIITAIFTILSIGTLAYFYYIKPQREFIKASTEDCLVKAMAPINNEVMKYISNSYVTRDIFKKMLKTQNLAIDKCMDSYNTFLFSPSERKLIYLNLNSRIDNQSANINNYTKKVDSRLAEQKIAQDKKKTCGDMQKAYDSYQECTKNEIQVNNNEFYSSSEYITSLFSSKPSGVDSRDICLKKYNYKNYGVDRSDCMMIDIFGG